MTKLTAVGVTCGIGSMLIGARQAGFKVVGQLEWRKYYYAEDEAGRNTFKENFPGAIFKHKFDDLELEEIERLMNADIALGHPESFHPNATVYTSEGWRRIGDIRKGDLVLTHRGRFRRVYRTIKYGAPEGTEEVTLSRNSRVSRSSLVTTSNHPVLMSDGSFKSAGSIRRGDQVVYLCNVCSKCGKLAPVHAVYEDRISCGCEVKKYWTSLSKNQRKKQVSAAHTKNRELAGAGKHHFSRIEIRQKGQLVQARSSELETKMLEALEARGIKVARQYSIGKYFVDFALPDLKIAVEVDGGNWHRTDRKRRQDEEKSSYLKSTGWLVVRTPPRPDRWIGGELDSVADQVVRLTLNHKKQYKFGAFAVGSVRRRTLPRGTTLCNLGVEEDETYIVKSVVTHNCGAYSQLSVMNPDRSDDPGDIPLFVDLIAKLKPHFFIMDDLPKSFKAFPMNEYHQRLQDYDLFPEWISNYHYGNIQKNRRRMFMLGAKKDQRWAFRPGEFEHSKTVASTIGDFSEPGKSNLPNHDPHVLDAIAGRGLHLVSLGRGARGTFRDVAEYLKDKPAGHMIRYVSEDGSIKGKPGSYRGNWDGPCHVLDGGSYAIHHHRRLPYTIRERAAIQGFPDDFIFYGTKLDEAGYWNHDKNVHMVKQTGKAMPIQFCAYVSGQVAAHLKGEPFESSGARLIAPNDYVDSAKAWYCENVGYADQQKACNACWLYDRCTIRMRKYKIGEPARGGQRDLIDPGVVPGPDSVAKSPREKKPARAGPPKVPRGPGRRFVELAPGASHDLDFTGGRKP